MKLYYLMYEITSYNFIFLREFFKDCWQCAHRHYILKDLNLYLYVVFRFFTQPLFNFFSYILQKCKRSICCHYILKLFSMKTILNKNPVAGPTKKSIQPSRRRIEQRFYCGAILQFLPQNKFWVNPPQHRSMIGKWERWVWGWVAEKQEIL